MSSKEIDDLLENIDQLLADVEQKEASRKLRRKHPYAKDLIEILLPYPKGLTRTMVIDCLERQRRENGLPIPEKFEHVIQSVYNHHSIDSSVFKKRGAPESEGLFYSPQGKGSGQWAVREAVAQAWLRT